MSGMEFEWSPFWISARTAMAATAAAFALGVPLAAWRLRTRARWAPAVDAAVLLPMVLPPTVVGLALLGLLGRGFPWGRALAEAGLGVVFSPAGAVIAATAVALPLVYVTTRAAFRQIEHELLDVARLEGCGGWRLLRRVLLPVAWPGVAAGLLLGFARALGEFGATLMIAGNIPGRTQTLPMAVFFAVEAGETGRAWAYAVGLAGGSVLALGALHLLERRRR
jgi:molybdate transport system permease protein